MLSEQHFLDTALGVGHILILDTALETGSILILKEISLYEIGRQRFIFAFGAYVFFVALKTTAVSSALILLSSVIVFMAALSMIFLKVI